MTTIERESNLLNWIAAIPDIVPGPLVRDFLLERQYGSARACGAGMRHCTMGDGCVCTGKETLDMAEYASLSPDATRLLREKTGSGTLECYIYIDPGEERKSFLLIRYPERIAHVSFADLEYDPASFTSLMEAVYNAIYG